MDSPVFGPRLCGLRVPHLSRITRRDCIRATVDLATEVAIVWSFLKAYNVVRDCFGSTAVSPRVAAAHARQVAKLELVLGFFWEQDIQAAALRWPKLVRFMNVYYWTAHMASTIGTLLLVFFLRSSMYQRARSGLLVMNVLALAGYALYPLMPPRLLDDCTTAFGGCEPGFRFVDTMHVYGGLWSWRQSAVAKISNHYAAMPSMHFGYSLWVAATVMHLLTTATHPSALQKATAFLVYLYPISMLVCIVVTANHFIFDAVCGAAALLAGHQLGRWVPQLGRGAHPGRAHWLGGRPGHEKQLPCTRTPTSLSSNGGFDAETQMSQTTCAAPLGHGPLSATDCRRQPPYLISSHRSPTDLRCVSVGAA